MADTQRYWDGERWTDHIAPGVARRTSPGAVTANVASTLKLETAGWLTAFFFPIAGVVIGIMLVSRPEKNQGNWILTVSIAMLVLAWLAFYATQAPALQG
jgi:hypothetical protein